MLRGWAVWLTGLPGSGKSTVAKLLARKLLERGVTVRVLSSDVLRKVLTPRPRYDEREREFVYGVLMFIAKLLTESGVNVLIDATGNRRRFRDKAAKQIGNYVEAYVKCPLDLCILRETGRKRRFGAPGRVYGKALTGRSRTVPGFGAPYEEPLNPDVVVETDKLNPQKSAEKILVAITRKFGLTTK